MALDETQEWSDTKLLELLELAKLVKLLELAKSVRQSFENLPPLLPMETRYMVMDKSTGWYVETDQNGTRLEE